MPQKLSPQIISAAIAGFEQQKIEIDQQIAELRAILNKGSEPAAATEQAPGRKRRKLSAAARKRIADAQKARWAKFHKQSAKPEPAPKPKRKLSAATKARLVANLKKARAAKAAMVRAATKKAAPARKKAAVKKAAPAPAATEAAAQ